MPDFSHHAINIITPGTKVPVAVANAQFCNPAAQQRYHCFEIFIKCIPLLVFPHFKHNRSQHAAAPIPPRSSAKISFLLLCSQERNKFDALPIIMHQISQTRFVPTHPVPDTKSRAAIGNALLQIGLAIPRVHKPTQKPKGIVHSPEPNALCNEPIPAHSQISAHQNVNSRKRQLPSVSFLFLLPIILSSQRILFFFCASLLHQRLQFLIKRINFVMQQQQGLHQFLCRNHPCERLSFFPFYSFLFL